MIRRILVASAATVAIVGVLGMPSSAGERQTSSLTWMPPSGNTGTVPGGWASLNSNGGGVSFTFHAREVNRQHTYTIWWVIFNHPEHCTTNPAGPLVCGAGDLANAAVLGSLQYAAGHVAGGSGRANFGGAIGVGDTRGCEEGLPCNGGLTNPAGAEIHLVLRTHGAAVPGWVDYQISSFNGACNAGEPNEGQCRNLQAAGFLL